MGLPNHQMVYNICFIPKRKQAYNHNYSILTRTGKTVYLFLKHVNVNLFIYRHFKTSPSRLFNKLPKLALVMSNFSHKHKSYFIDLQRTDVLS